MSGLAGGGQLTNNGEVIETGEEFAVSQGIDPDVAPPIPTADNTDTSAAEEEQRRQKGRAATVLSGNRGVLSGLNLASRTLIGN